MTWIQLARDLNYILTLVALPLAILALLVFLYGQHRYRRKHPEHKPLQSNLPRKDAPRWKG